MQLSKIIILISFFFICCDDSNEYDVIIVGGGAGGTSAAIESARNGAKTLLIEETDWLGFWGEFKDSLVSHYGSLESLKTGWVSNVLFEPKVGNEILKSIANKEENLKILFSSSVNSVFQPKDDHYNFIVN